MTVGVAQFDLDHERIIEALNALVAALDRHDTAVETVFGRLMAVVERHFMREERVMAACAYDGLEYHAREHRKIRDRLLDIRAHHLHSSDAAIRAEVREFLTNWLYGHVLVDDFAYRGVFQEGDQRVAKALG